MRKHRAGASGLFLMELILSILFFSVAAAICLRVFAGAHVMSTEAHELDQGTTLCSNAAELLLTIQADDDPDEILSLYPDPLRMVSIENADISTGDADASDVNTASAAEIGEIGLWQAAYDADFLACEPDVAAYLLTICVVTEDDMLHGDISLSHAVKDTEPIYTLSIDHYLGRRTYE